MTAPGNKKAPAITGAIFITVPLISQINSAGVGTMRSERWLPGIFGPFPSATLDKSANYSLVGECTMLPFGCQRICPAIFRGRCG